MATPSFGFSLLIEAATAAQVRDLTVSGHLDLPSFTVATLPVTTTPGRTVFCSNVRNAGEAAGSGTGSVVQWSGGRWHIPGIATAVQA